MKRRSRRRITAVLVGHEAAVLVTLFIVIPLAMLATVAGLLHFIILHYSYVKQTVILRIFGIDKHKYIYYHTNDGVTITLYKRKKK